MSKQCLVPQVVDIMTTVVNSSIELIEGFHHVINRTFDLGIVFECDGHTLDNKGTQSIWCLVTPRELYRC